MQTNTWNQETLFLPESRGEGLFGHTVIMSSSKAHSLNFGCVLFVTSQVTNFQQKMVVKQYQFWSIKNNGLN